MVLTTSRLSRLRFLAKGTSQVVLLKSPGSYFVMRSRLTMWQALESGYASTASLRALSENDRARARLVSTCSLQIGGLSMLRIAASVGLCCILSVAVSWAAQEKKPEPTKFKTIDLQAKGNKKLADEMHGRTDGK